MAKKETGKTTYRVLQGTISGDLNDGDIFDPSEERFVNHDIPFLLERGLIEEVVSGEIVAEEAPAEPVVV